MLNRLLKWFTNPPPAFEAPLYSRYQLNQHGAIVCAASGAGCIADEAGPAAAAACELGLKLATTLSEQQLRQQLSDIVAERLPKSPPGRGTISICFFLMIRQGQQIICLHSGDLGALAFNIDFRSGKLPSRPTIQHVQYTHANDWCSV